jgi:hypothetical protein
LFIVAGKMLNICPDQQMLKTKPTIVFVSWNPARITPTLCSILSKEFVLKEKLEKQQALLAEMALCNAINYSVSELF